MVRCVLRASLGGLLCLIVLLGVPGGGLAFSVGELRVQSVWGKPFRAELPVTLRADEVGEPFSVTIADPDAYRLVGLPRRPSVERVTLHPTGGGVNRRIILRSDVPLRDASFNLLLVTAVGAGSHYRNHSVVLDGGRREGGASHPPSTKRPTVGVSWLSSARSVTVDAGALGGDSEHQAGGVYRAARGDVVVPGSLEKQLAMFQQRLETLERLTAQSSRTAASWSQRPFSPDASPVAVPSATRAVEPLPAPQKVWHTWAWYGVAGLVSFFLAGLLAWWHRPKVEKTVGFDPPQEGVQVALLSGEGGVPAQSLAISEPTEPRESVAAKENTEVAGTVVPVVVPRRQRGGAKGPVSLPWLIDGDGY